MKTVFKYELGPEKKIQIYVGAEILRVDAVGQQVFMWALVDTQNAKEERYFKIYGTGHVINDKSAKYIGGCGTAQGLQWHVFEVKGA
jgi:hypothetical protein